MLPVIPERLFEGVFCFIFSCLPDGFTALNFFSSHSSVNFGSAEKAHLFLSSHFLLLNFPMHSAHSLHCQSEAQAYPPLPPELPEPDADEGEPEGADCE